MMKVELYSFVGLYAKGLDTLSNILSKGAAHAGASRTPEAEMLDWQLVPDMFPLRRQAEIVIDFARQWPARAAGLTVPPPLEGPTSIARLQDAIREARAYLDDLDPGQFAGRDDLMLTLDIGQMEPSMTIGQWISGFATTNFYFHLSIAYAILRLKGIPLGKRDLFAGGL